MVCYSNIQAFNKIVADFALREFGGTGGEDKSDDVLARTKCNSNLICKNTKIIDISRGVCYSLRAITKLKGGNT